MQTKNIYDFLTELNLRSRSKNSELLAWRQSGIKRTDDKWMATYNDKK